MHKLISYIQCFFFALDIKTELFQYKIYKHKSWKSNTEKDYHERLDPIIVNNEMFW